MKFLHVVLALLVSVLFSEHVMADVSASKTTPNTNRMRAEDLITPTISNAERAVLEDTARVTIPYAISKKGMEIMRIGKAKILKRNPQKESRDTVNQQGFLGCIPIQVKQLDGEIAKDILFNIVLMQSNTSDAIAITSSLGPLELLKDYPASEFAEQCRLLRFKQEE